jgi:hypothetical protein
MLLKTQPLLPAEQHCTASTGLPNSLGVRRRNRKHGRVLQHPGGVCDECNPVTSPARVCRQRSVDQPDLRRRRLNKQHPVFNYQQCAGTYVCTSCPFRVRTRHNVPSCHVAYSCSAATAGPVPIGLSSPAVCCLKCFPMCTSPSAE